MRISVAKRNKRLKLLVYLGILLAGIESMNAQHAEGLKWKKVDRISIPIPPSEHPRLYLRSKDIPDLKRRVADPKLAHLWTELENMAKDDYVDDGTVKTWREYVRQRGITVRSEMNAIRYLTTGKKDFGRKAIKDILNKMQKSNWPQVNNIARAAGRLMVSGAIVFDWCHDLLTPKEKDAFVAEFVRLAKMLECGYPPVKQTSVTGHSSEWMIMRDLLSASIAIYDEFPEMYELAAGRFFREHLPARNWFYKGEAYHQGIGYNRVRLGADLYPLWIFSRMGADNVYESVQQFVPYHFMYSRRPDGQFLASGDVNYWSEKDRDESIALVALLAGSYYKDEYLNHQYLNNPNINSMDKIVEFLWWDTSLGKKEPTDLPLTKYFGEPFGWMIARTGWDSNGVIAEMKVNEYNFLNHQHHDAGAFQIYYKGPLAIDSGMYSGSSGGYNSEHNKNYFKRTIAHNSLLVYDPNETFKSLGYGGEQKTQFVGNDGGQRLPGDGWHPPNTLDDLLMKDYKTGEILASGYGPNPMQPDYSYLKGDITLAYSDKVKEVKRSFVFLNLNNESIPAAFIVFDKIISADESFQKYWLLHSIEEPIVDGNQSTIVRTKNGDSGKLINTTVLPELENLDIEVVGGKGKEFWVFGKNYENNPTKRPDTANERGGWRIEVKPKTASKQDYFLNVIQVTDTGVTDKYALTKVEGKNVIGVKIKDRVVFFGKESNKVSSPINFKIAGEGLHKILLTDLHTGVWQIEKDGKSIGPFMVEPEKGTLYFEGISGKYQLRKRN